MAAHDIALAWLHWPMAEGGDEATRVEGREDGGGLCLLDDLGVGSHAGAQFSPQGCSRHIYRKS